MRLGRCLVSPVMHRIPSFALGLILTMTLGLPGCALRDGGCEFHDDENWYQDLAREIAYEEGSASAGGMTDLMPPPITLNSDSLPITRPMTLGEVVEAALANSETIRDLGGTVLRAPEDTQTVQSPAIHATDPRFGVEAALSAFDAQLSTSLFFEKNDRALNNRFLGGGNFILLQDLAAMEAEIMKQTATGTTFAVRELTDYDSNNAIGNFFPSAWNTNLEAEFRHPLLQGAGVRFNRIAGPNAAPGLLNGVLLARLNTSVSVAEFEIALRDLLSNVENAYWDLYFAYRDLDAKIAARDASLETWRKVHALYVTRRRGGEAEKEAQAREQYFRLQEEVQNALTGRMLPRTRTNNGSSGGTFFPVGGVHAAERQLRLAIGIPINDGQLIHPADEPVMAKVVFHWDEIACEALARRAELRRQRNQVERRELELVANRNFLLPRLDTLGRYRWRGFGHDLLNPDSEGKPRFDNAFANLTSGEFQEWQLGVELSVPLGYRRENAAVRHAQLQLSRERAILKEQEREVLYGLSNMVADLDRAHAVTQTAYNRLVAARQELRAAQVAFGEDRAPIDLVLDAQERQADAESRFYRAQVEYALAVKNVHFEKGSLLDYNGVLLAEQPCPSAWQVHACRLGAGRSFAPELDYALSEKRREESDRGPAQQVEQASFTTPDADPGGTQGSAAPPNEPDAASIVPLPPT